VRVALKRTVGLLTEVSTARVQVIFRVCEDEQGLVSPVLVSDHDCRGCESSDRDSRIAKVNACDSSV